MSTVKNFLQKHFSEVAAIHAKHKSLAEAAGDEHGASYHEDMHNCFKAACEECGGSGGDATKAVDDGAKGIGVQTITVAEMQELRENVRKITQFAESFGDRIQPDQVRGVIPNNQGVGIQAVTRPGQPELVNKRDVPIEFQDLLKVGD